MKNVQKETRNQEMRLKDFGCKALDAIEMLVVLATAALLLIGSAVTAKAEPVSGQHENSILPRVEFNIAVPEGNVDNETLDLADRILNTLPDKLLNEFIESDWKLYVTSNMPVLTFFSGIYGEPNGRPDLEAHYIEVTSDQETMGKTLLHEFGHYVDYTKGDVSLKSEFENIYENSSEAFADTFGIYTEGYDQSEFFADGFAKYYSGYSHQMEKEYPELCRYIKAAISKDNVSRKSVQHIQEGCSLLFYFFSKKRYILFFFGILNVSNEIAEDGLKTEANKNICIKKGEVKWDLN